MNILQELLEMSKSVAIDIEQDLKRRFMLIDIILEFSNHFTERLVSDEKDKNGFRRDNISEDELKDIFLNLKEKHKELFKEIDHFFDEVKRGTFEGVIQQSFKNINVPFVLSYNKRLNKINLVCKTIMKKDKGKFHTDPKDHIIKV